MGQSISAATTSVPNLKDRKRKISPAYHENLNDEFNLNEELQNYHNSHSDQVLKKQGSRLPNQSPPGSPGKLSRQMSKESNFSTTAGPGSHSVPIGSHTGHSRKHSKESTSSKNKDHHSTTNGNGTTQHKIVNLDELFNSMNHNNNNNNYSGNSTPGIGGNGNPTTSESQSLADYLYNELKKSQIEQEKNSTLKALKEEVNDHDDDVSTNAGNISPTYSQSSNFNLNYNNNTGTSCSENEELNNNYSPRGKNHQKAENYNTFDTIKEVESNATITVNGDNSNSNSTTQVSPKNSSTFSFGQNTNTQVSRSHELSNSKVGSRTNSKESNTSKMVSQSTPMGNMIGLNRDDSNDTQENVKIMTGSTTPNGTNTNSKDNSTLNTNTSANQPFFYSLNLTSLFSPRPNNGNSNLNTSTNVGPRSPTSSTGLGSYSKSDVPIPPPSSSPGPSPRHIDSTSTGTMSMSMSSHRQNPIRKDAIKQNAKQHVKESSDKLHANDNCVMKFDGGRQRSLLDKGSFKLEFFDPKTGKKVMIG